MNLNAFIEQVGEQFDDLGGITLTAETAFREVPGWCSIVALSIISMVDEEYDVQLKGDDIRAAKTIKDIFDVVASRKG